VLPLDKPNPGPDYWADIPGDRHDRQGTLAFADGHSENHRWRGLMPTNFLAKAQGENLEDVLWMKEQIPPP
jgi:prepilin-type processing-associated H-X9-DG protein